MEKEVLSNLIVSQYKFDLLSEHLKTLSGSDIFYEDIQLNYSSILKDVFQIVGFPFFGKNVSPEYQELYDYLEEYYFDNVFLSEYKNLSDLNQRVKEYVEWLKEQKIKFDSGTLEINREET